MDRDSRRTLRVGIAAAVVAVAVAGLFLLVGRSTPTSAQQRSLFMGGNPTSLAATVLPDSQGVVGGDIRVSRLRFPAGSRSNWHTHTQGQLLMLEAGKGLTQVRGQPIQEMRPGEPWYTAAGVEHWHGAAPDEAAVQLTIYGGDVNWLEPVTDDQYKQPARRR
jgi:quercetin dioxygenase-like cupin family protein